MLNSCASTATVSVGTLYGNYDYITEVYYESNRDLIVVYINDYPYYKMWDYSKRVYYYSPVPSSYWRNIVYRPYYKYGYPKYYRHLPPPYRPKYSDRRPNYRYKSDGRPIRYNASRPSPRPNKPKPDKKMDVGSPVRRIGGSGTVVRQRQPNSTVSRNQNRSSTQRSTTSSRSSRPTSSTRNIRR